MRSVLNKICRENQNTHFMFSDAIPKIVHIYEIMSNKMVESERKQYGACAWHTG